MRDINICQELKKISSLNTVFKFNNSIFHGKCIVRRMCHDHIPLNMEFNYVKHSPVQFAPF